METSPLTRHIVAEELPLERLAGNAQLTEQEKIAGVSRHFEAVLLRQFLTEAQKPLLNSKGSMGGASSDIYKDMIVNVLSDGISKSGAFGLAKFFQTQMVAPHSSDNQHPPGPAPSS
jgi:Rod binding domain-containing protein